MKKMTSILDRLRAILAFFRKFDPSERPQGVIRKDLPETLRVTQAELLREFGIKNRSELPKKLRHSVVVASRVHTGRDCYRTICGAVTGLLAELESTLEQRACEEAERVSTLRKEVLALRARINLLLAELREEHIGFLQLASTSGALSLQLDKLEERWNGAELRFEEKVYSTYLAKRRANRLPSVRTRGGERLITADEFYQRALKRVLQGRPSSRNRAA